jgi:AcrR family transcriptional regulator
MARITRSLHHKRAKFLEHYKELCVISKAAEAAGIQRRTFYDWLEKSAEFKAAFEDARKHVSEKLEAEAIRRAYDGVEEPVFYKGLQIGTIRKYSDTLLIFLLKAADPEKYREKSSLELTGRSDQPIESVVRVVDV